MGEKSGINDFLLLSFVFCLFIFCLFSSYVAPSPVAARRSHAHGTGYRGVFPPLKRLFRSCGKAAQQAAMIRSFPGTCKISNIEPYEWLNPHCAFLTAQCAARAASTSFQRGLPGCFHAWPSHCASGEQANGSEVKLYALGQGQIGTEIDCVGLPAHILFPGV